MGKYSELAAVYHVDSKRRARYELSTIALAGRPTPALILVFAGDGNASWKSAQHKSVALFKAAKNTREEIEIMAAMLADAAIVDWENVTANGGTPVTFSADECRELLLDILGGVSGEAVIKAIWSFATNPENFRGALPSPVDLGKK